MISRLPPRRFVSPAIWFPAIRTGTGTDVFTQRLVDGLRARGIGAEITWLPLRAEYAPWTVPVPRPPVWATVCHVNSWLHPRFIPELPMMATLHHSIHDPALRPYKGWLRAAYHKYWIAPIERRVLRRAERVVAVSHFVADMARQTLCGVPMRVIYNGIDTEQFCPGNRVRQAGEPFRLLYVGSWTARKGVDLLGPIMRELGEGFELRYTGGPASGSDKQGMPPNMQDLGRLSGPQVVAAMQDADAFLFPSRSEGLPLAAIEAMACGLPVIATRGSSLVEVVEDGVSGLLCAQGSAWDFAMAARKLAGLGEAWVQMSHLARSSAVAKYSFQNMIESHITAYQALR